MKNRNNFLESVFVPNERIVIPERFGWYLWMQITRVSRLSMDFSQKVSSRIKWIILSHVFGSPTLPIKQIVLKMRSTIFLPFVMTLHLITNKNTTKKTSMNVSPTQTTLGCDLQTSDKWKVFWDPNDIWPSRWVAWRENDMWHPRPSCSPWRPVRSVKKDAKGKDNSVELISCFCLFFPFWVALFSRVLC